MCFVDIALFERPIVNQNCLKKFYCNYIFYSSKLNLNIVLVALVREFGTLGGVSDYFSDAIQIEEAVSNKYEIKFKNTFPLSKLMWDYTDEGYPTLKSFMINKRKDQIFDDIFK